MCVTHFTVIFALCGGLEVNLQYFWRIPGYLWGTYYHKRWPRLKIPIHARKFKDDKATLAYQDYDCHVPLICEMRVKEGKKLKGGAGVCVWVCVCVSSCIGILHIYLTQLILSTREIPNGCSLKGKQWFFIVCLSVLYQRKILRLLRTQGRTWVGVILRLGGAVSA